MIGSRLCSIRIFSSGHVNSLESDFQIECVELTKTLSKVLIPKIFLHTHGYVTKQTYNSRTCPKFPETPAVCLIARMRRLNARIISPRICQKSDVT
jgi:hypothetical protein